MGELIELERARATSSSNIQSLQQRFGGFEDYSPRERPDWQTTWQTAIRQQLGRILSFKAGWDGYSASNMAPETVLFTTQILERLWRPNLPVPDISPLSDGSLMLEWFSPHQSLTLEIERPNSINVLCEHADGSVDELHISSDISFPESKLSEFVEPPVANAALG